MRIAAIYDIHGNAPALESVIENAAAEQVDHIVIGGDVVSGPMPKETLGALLQVEVPLHFVCGNADREIIAYMSGGGTSEEVPEKGRQQIAWVAQQLESEYRELLSTWKDTVRLQSTALGEVLFCHATPQNDTTIFTRLTPEDLLLPKFSETAANLVVCGHTHMQFDRTIGKVRVVNAGSVGMPYGERGAHWLMIDSDVQFRCTLYDFEKAANRVRTTGYPDAEEFAERTILRPHSEAAVLDVFEPRALGEG